MGPATILICGKEVLQFKSTSPRHVLSSMRKSPRGVTCEENIRVTDYTAEYTGPTLWEESIGIVGIRSMRPKRAI